MLIIRPMRRSELAQRSKGKTFDVVAAGKSLGRVTDQGAITLDGRNFTVNGGGVTSPGARETLAILKDGHLPKLTWLFWVLRDADEKVVVTSERAGPRGYTITYGSDTFRFARASMVSSTWHLYPPAGDVPLGTIAKQGWFGSTCTVEFPESIDTLLQVFLFWQRLRWELDNSSDSTPYISS